MSASPAVSLQNASVAVAPPSNAPTTPQGSPSAASTVNSPSSAFDDQAVHDDRFNHRGDYLGNPAILNACTWGEDEEVSNGDILKWSDTGEPALLCSVAQVVPDRMKLSPLGNHEEKYGKPISDAKIQFTVGGCLSSAVLQQAWGTTTSVLQQLQRMGASTAQHRHLLTEHRGRTGVRISCPVFVGRTEVYDPTGKDRADAVLSYPVPPAQRPALASIVENYRLNDFRVYDTDGSLIHPSVFATRLPGAVVEVWFSLHHFLFGNNGGERASDTFTARLFQLRVLRRNTRGVGSPFAGRNPALGPYVPPSPPSRLNGGPLTNVGGAGRVLTFGAGPTVNGALATAGSIASASGAVVTGAPSGAVGTAAPAVTPDSLGTSVNTPTATPASTGEAVPPAPSPPVPGSTPPVEHPIPRPVDAAHGPGSATPATSPAGSASPTDGPASQTPSPAATGLNPDSPSPPTAPPTPTPAPVGVDVAGGTPSSDPVTAPSASEASAGSLAPAHLVVEGASDGNGRRRASEAGPSTRSTKKIRLTFNGRDA